MADILHANNLSADRNLGRYWEEKFCELAAQYGRSFTENQIGRQRSAIAKDSRFNVYTLPDITVWTAPGEHHEIKHKNPFPDYKYGPSFGLEEYRYKALLWFAHETKQSVMYTIHNHDLSGGRDAKVNDIKHWITADVLYLFEKWHTRRDTNSYVSGISRSVPTLYWHANLWDSLKVFWFKPDLSNAILIPTCEARIGDIYKWNGHSSTIFEITAINNNLAQRENMAAWYSLNDPQVEIYRRP